MKNYLFEVSADIKDFLSDGINRLTVIVIVLGCIVCFLQYTSLKKIDTVNLAISEQLASSEKNLSSKIETTKDRVNHRYFCLNTTLKEIFGVDINTKTGELKK